MKMTRTEYLLAELIGLQTGEMATDVITRIDQEIKPEKVALDQKEASDSEVLAIYNAYPTKCPKTGRLTGKSSKDKKKIMTLLKTTTCQTLLQKIESYVRDCKEHDVYLKNFSTFLNNIPDDTTTITPKADHPYYR